MLPYPRVASSVLARFSLQADDIDIMECPVFSTAAFLFLCA
jgi:hypothetical protein